MNKALALLTGLAFAGRMLAPRIPEESRRKHTMQRRAERNKYAYSPTRGVYVKGA